MKLRSERAVIDLIELAVAIPIFVTIFIWTTATYRPYVFDLQLRSAIELAFKQVDPSKISPIKDANFPAEMDLCGAKIGSGGLICPTPTGNGAFFDNVLGQSYVDALINTIKNNLTASGQKPWSSPDAMDRAVQCVLLRSAALPGVTDPYDPNTTSPIVQTDDLAGLFGLAGNANYTAQAIAKDYFSGVGFSIPGHADWLADSRFANSIAPIWSKYPALYVICSGIIQHTTGDNTNPYRYVNYWQALPLESFGGIR